MTKLQKKTVSKGSDTVTVFTTKAKAMLCLNQGGVTIDPYAWCMERVTKEVVPKRLKIHRGQFRIVDWPLHGKVLSSIEARYRPSIQKLIWRDNP